jgi:hypothetical protein
LADFKLSGCEEREMNRQQMIDFATCLACIPVFVFALIKSRSGVFSFGGLLILVSAIGLFWAIRDFFRKSN